MRILQIVFFICFIWGVAGNCFAETGIQIPTPPKTVQFFEEEPQGLTRIYVDSTLFQVNPPLFKRIVELDSAGTFVSVSESIAKKEFLLPSIIDIESYIELRLDFDRKALWKNIALQELIPKEERESGAIELEIPIRIKNETFTRIFGSDKIGLKVTGNISFDLSGRSEERSGTAVSAVQNQGTFSPKFTQTQQFTIEGKIGEKVTVSVEQNSEATFDFENTLKLRYKGEEDEIIQSIEAGNIGLSLPSTKYVIFGGSNQGLFGIKTHLKVGNFYFTGIASLEKGEQKKLSISGSATESRDTFHDYDFIKNRYFFIDTLYQENFEKGFDGIETTFIYQESSNNILEFDVYKSTHDGDTDGQLGIAVLDPTNSEYNIQDISTIEEVEGEVGRAYFKQLKKDIDYDFYPGAGFFWLKQQYKDEIIAVAYKTEKKGEVGTLFTSINADTTKPLVLRLIQPRNMSFEEHKKVWPLMMRNVYSLGGTNIEEEGFEVQIENNETGTSDPIQQVGERKSYLNILGLDRMDENSSKIEGGDKIIDAQHSTLVNLVDGILIFPGLQPFDPIEYTELADTNRVHMYDTRDERLMRELTKYEIIVTSKSTKSSFNLGFNILEGSEEVLLNGAPLKRDTDYIIDYFTGQLTLVSPEAKRKSSNIEIKYEKATIFQLDKKTILGGRAEYRFWDDSFIGLTALYMKKSTIDKRVRVGQEPFSNFVWDINTALKFKPRYLTKWVDALPFIETNAPSSINIEAEFAQVLPDPNTLDNEETGDNNGVAYIDDFESTKRTTTLGIRYPIWTQSSPPKILGDADSTVIDTVADKSRGKILWYNPYNQVNIKKIWPERDTNSQTGYTTDVLALQVSRNEEQDPDKAWVGIMRSTLSFANQQRTKYIELWVNDISSSNQNKVRINIDIGKISEDWYLKSKINGRLVYGGDSRGGLNDEDKNKNKYLDEDEDTGIDGLPNIDPADDPDDDWREPNRSNDTYEGINGTEGNSAARGSRYPDTEDLDGNGQLNTSNAYFEYTFSLDAADPNYQRWLNGETVDRDTGEKTGWKQIRIPLNQFTRMVGNPDTTFQSIYYVRLWMANLDTIPQKIYFATIDFVGNEWEEDGIAPDDSSGFVKDTSFAITVYNTEENFGAPANYRSPPGVEGLVDPVTKARSKEQSMVLDVNNLPGGARAQARKTLFGQSLSLLNYKRLRMFVYGKSDDLSDVSIPNNPQEDSSKIKIYLQFGFNDNNYYEYGQGVYKGWYKGNEIDIDVDEMAKTKFSENKERKLNNKPEGYYKVVGNPSLGSIRYFKIGIRNSHGDANMYFNGEIWLDEMRVSDVRQESGTALRLATSVKLADLMTFNAQWERKDADFHDIKTQFGSGNTTESQNYSGKINLDKFLPDSWNLSLPVDARFSTSKSIPKYIPTTDILTNYKDDTIGKKIQSLFGLRKISPGLDSLITQSEVFGIGTTIKKRSRSDAWYLYYTIDQVSIDFDYSIKKSRNYKTEFRDTESWRETFSYSIPFEKNNYVEPFKFFEKTPVLSLLSDQKIYYTPSSTSMNLTVIDVKDKNKLRQETKITRNVNTNSTRRININYRLLPSVNLTYGRTHKADADFENLKGKDLFKSIITKFDFGKDTDINQNFQANYKPQIFDWLKTDYTYQTTFGFRYTNLAKFQKQSNSNVSKSTSISFSPSKLANMIYQPEQQQTGKSRGSRGRPKKNQEKDKDESDNEGDKTENEDEPSEKKKFPNPLLWIHGFFDAWQSLTMKYTWSQNVTNSFVTDIPSWRYQFGLTQDTGVPQDTTLSKFGPTLSDLKSLNTSISYKIANNITATFNHKYDTKENKSDSRRTGSESITFFAWGDDLSGDLKGVGKGYRNFIPDWTIKISGVEKFLFFKSFAKSMSIEHGRNGRYITPTTAAEGGELKPDSHRLSHNFQPLIGVSISWLWGISTNFRYTTGTTLNLDRTGGANKSENNSFSISANYSTSGGFEIPIPIWPFKGHKFKNEINLSIVYESSLNKSFQRLPTQKEFQENRNDDNWKLRPSATYRFSKRVSGSLFYEMGVRNSKRTGEYSWNEFGITCNIAIRD